MVSLNGILHNHVLKNTYRLVFPDKRLGRTYSWALCTQSWRPLQTLIWFLGEVTSFHLGYCQHCRFPDIWPKFSVLELSELQDSFLPTSLKSLVSLPNRKAGSYTCLHRAHKTFWLSFMWHEYWRDFQAFLLSHYVSKIVLLPWGVECKRYIL